MPTSLLVTWATKYGSTAEVAQSIAAVLRENGYLVEARPMSAVRSLDSFDAVVLGCALYMSRIHGDARRFLAAHREALTRRPVALFVLGPIHNEENEQLTARSQLDRQLAKFPWFHPAVQGVFGGRFDPSMLGWLRWLPALRNMPVSDARDWQAIHAWAVSLPLVLHSPALSV